MSDKNSQELKTVSDFDHRNQTKDLPFDEINPFRADEEFRSRPEQIENRVRTYEMILSTIADFAYCFNRAGQFIFVNQALLDLWGLKLEEAVGKNFFELHYPEDLAARLQRQIQQVFETRQDVKDETPYTSPTGAGGFYEYIFSPVCAPDGSVEMVVGTTRDISERKKIAEDLAKLNLQIKRQSKIFDATLSTIPDNICSFDRDGRFHYANQTLLNLWGLTAEQAIGKTFEQLPYPKDLSKKLLEQTRYIFETGQTVRDVTPYTEADGTTGYFEYIFSPFFGQDGEVELIVASSRDISELKQAEIVLRNNDRRKDEFLATLAHELRNPLAPIRSGLEIIRRELGDPAVVEKTLDVIERQTNQIIHLVDDLLDISRISQGKIKLRKKRIELKSAIELALESTRDEIIGNEHEFSLSLPKEKIFLDADLTRIAQIFLNLLNNANKYTPPGGKIHLSAEKDDDHVKIVVADTGIGIPPEMLPGIFNLFSQIRSTSEQARSGLGIGLSVVKKLVEMHGGSVTPYSEGKGKGSRFVVRLPLAADQTPSKADPVSTGEIIQTADLRPPREKRPPAAKKHRVLVVDDNSDAVRMLEYLLSSAGHVVGTAFDGETALKKAPEFQPDACLLDIGLPKMNGYELAENLRRLLPGVVLIAISGWGQKEDRQRSKEAGFDYHLVKPVDVDQVEELLSGLLKRDAGNTEN